MCIVREGKENLRGTVPDHHLGARAGISRVGSTHEVALTDRLFSHLEESEMEFITHCGPVLETSPSAQALFHASGPAKQAKGTPE